MRTATKKNYAFKACDVFSVHVQNHGSGWKGIHVAVNKWERYPDNTPNTILLTRDALSPEEFDMHIDELIELLNDLRSVGRRKLEKIKREEEKSRAVTSP